MNKSVITLFVLLILSVFIFLGMQFINYEDNNIAIIIEKTSGILSLVFTIAFSLTFNFNLKATFNKEIYELRVKVKNLTVINTNKIDINYNKINKELPCLGLDIVGYTINESLFATNNSNNEAIVFDNPNDLENELKYFMLLEPKGIIVRNDEIQEISDFRKTTFQGIKLQNGFAITDKPYYLFVFNLKNVSKEYTLNVYPEVKSKTEAKITNNIIHRKSLAPNEKILFMVLINHASNSYEIDFTFFDNSKNKYKQSIGFEVDNEKLGIYEDKFLPPSKFE